jgi:hypothetical protein
LNDEEYEEEDEEDKSDDNNYDENSSYEMFEKNNDVKVFLYKLIKLGELN